MQPQSTTSKEYSVALLSIELKTFFDKTQEIGEDLSPEKLQVAHSVNIIVAKDKDNQIVVEIGLKYGDGKKDYSEIKLGFKYQISNLLSVMVINQETKQVSFDESLLYTLLPASFSAARGYYAAKLGDSPLSAFPFPILRSETIVGNCRILIEQ